MNREEELRARIERAFDGEAPGVGAVDQLLNLVRTQSGNVAPLRGGRTLLKGARLTWVTTLAVTVAAATAAVAFVALGPSRGGQSGNLGVSRGAAATTATTSPTPGSATQVQIPGDASYAEVSHGYELVQLPGDQATIGQAQATTTADPWLQKVCGTTTVSDVVLAHVENPEQPSSDGGTTSAIGPLEWKFIVIGPNNYADGFGAGNIAGVVTPSTSATPYPYSDHYCFVSVDATTGQESGFLLN